ncbi:class I SAM-dependent methyltransferase [Polymorphobacter sp.]|uniref:class I SAM-dependent methyltransferase n=1 Tax=Polymorphobacter sp. TaxID=1909290 RepID=UPI003F7038E7
MPPVTELDYFEHSRREIAPLLPEAPGRVLEVGCSSGATLAWLKDRWPGTETVGVDGYEPIRDVLDRNADTAIIQNLEAPLPDLGRFDLILALDILEHLTDPAAVLTSLVSRLNPGGRVIVSVPNVGHVSILSDLLLRRRFEYQDAGILDRTHLRFFTEDSAVALMNAAGLVVGKGVVNGLSGGRTKLANALTFGLFSHYFAKQYIMMGQVSGSPQGRVDWQF